MFLVSVFLKTRSKMLGKFFALWLPWYRLICISRWKSRSEKQCQFYQQKTEKLYFYLHSFQKVAKWKVMWIHWHYFFKYKQIFLSHFCLNCCFSILAVLQIFDLKCKQKPVFLCMKLFHMAFSEFLKCKQKTAFLVVTLVNWRYPNIWLEM